MKSFAEPQVLIGKLHQDNRGNVSFVNDFSFPKVKRFYMVQNTPEEPIRAFHGHMKEAKYVFVPVGKIKLILAPLTDSQNPDKNVALHSYILTDEKPTVVFVPPGFANGFKSLTSDAQVIFFSTSTIAQSQADDFRFPIDYWGMEVWKD